MFNQSRCPFLVGDCVVYKPSNRGIDLDVMSSMSERLIQGDVYRVTKIEDGLYVVVDGYSHPGGGLYWTEFEIVLLANHIKNNDPL